MPQGLKIQEIQCKSAIGKCGFPGGGFAVNPYVGCQHACTYCYARFMKRFTGHASKKWGGFVDVRINIAEVLEKQLKSKKYKEGIIYIGTVTDPYQPLEKKYNLTKKILEVLANYNYLVSILTKSDMIIRDINLLKKFNKIDVNFTVTSLDKKWVQYTEPNSSSLDRRLEAMKKLTQKGITVYAMVGPYWPIFTNPEELFIKFKEIGVNHIFSESFNTVGGNFTEVEKVLKTHYPEYLNEMREILFNKQKFHEFYDNTKKRLKQLSAQYNIPVTIFFGMGHESKFKK